MASAGDCNCNRQIVACCILVSMRQVTDIGGIEISRLSHMCVLSSKSYTAQQDTWRGSKGSSLGVGSRTNSEDLDSMRGIPQLLRTRNSGAVGATLPELGALLGRGSFGKVYKGQRLHFRLTHLDQTSCLLLLPETALRPFHHSASLPSECDPRISRQGRYQHSVHCAGRWKGAMVAVKIIEHSADINSKIEGFRENVVSSNIQHPNVVSL